MSSVIPAHIPFSDGFGSTSAARWPRVLLAPTAELAQAVLAEEQPVLTVEAEYGAIVVKGRLYTAAHHQPVGSPFAGRHVQQGDGRPSPCNDIGIPLLAPSETILVSHVDLDTFGGCLRAFGGFEALFNSANSQFWDLAEFVDVKGPHRTGEFPFGVNREWVLLQLHAFWAWSLENRAPRGNQVHDVTELVVRAGRALSGIFEGVPTLLDAGRKLRADNDERNRASFVGMLVNGQIILRKSAGQFVNDLYVDPTGFVGDAVVSLNEETGAVTLSLARPEAHPGVSCRAVAQELWGIEAGGHDGIAGSPRGVRLSETERDRAAVALQAKLLGVD